MQAINRDDEFHPGNGQKSAVDIFYVIVDPFVGPGRVTGHHRVLGGFEFLDHFRLGLRRIGPLQPVVILMPLAVYENRVVRRGGPQGPGGVEVAVWRVPDVDQQILAEAFEDQAVAVGVFVVGGAAAAQRRDEIVFSKPGRDDHPADIEMTIMPCARRRFRRDGRIIEDRRKYPVLLGLVLRGELRLAVSEFPGDPESDVREKPLPPSPKLTCPSGWRAEGMRVNRKKSITPGQWMTFDQSSPFFLATALSSRISSLEV